MDEVHCLISDASKKVDVEAHVLRYWEEELELDIPCSEMGYWYYTDLHIRLFKQAKNLKEEGFQLKTIKHALNQVFKKDEKAQAELPDEILECDTNAALNELREEGGNTSLSIMKSDGVSVVAMEGKMEQFQQIMNLIVGRTLETNNEGLSQDISCLVNEEMGRELEFLLQASGEKEEERFRQLDEALRAYQEGEQAEAAAAKVSPFKCRKFGRSGKKLRDGKQSGPHVGRGGRNYKMVQDRTYAATAVRVLSCTVYNSFLFWQLHPLSILLQLQK